MDASEGLRRTELLFGTSAVNALARTRVLIVGVGGVGGWCAEALVRTGVGHVTIVDDDVVAPSNLNRQVTATVPVLGRLKVEVLAERLKAVAPALDLTVCATRYTPELAGAFDLTAFDFVIDAIDSVPCKAALIRRATATGGPVLFSSMGAGCRTDLTRIRATPFAKVAGDGLARALRQRFKRDGGGPVPRFTCVWSDEPPANRGERRPEDGRANGSYMPVTAAFGLHLADLVRRACLESPVQCAGEG